MWSGFMGCDTSTSSRLLCRVRSALNDDLCITPPRIGAASASSSFFDLIADDSTSTRHFSLDEALDED